MITPHACGLRQAPAGLLPSSRRAQQELAISQKDLLGSCRPIKFFTQVMRRIAGRLQVRLLQSSRRCRSLSVWPPRRRPHGAVGSARERTRRGRRPGGGRAVAQKNHAGRWGRRGAGAAGGGGATCAGAEHGRPRAGPARDSPWTRHSRLLLDRSILVRPGAARLAPQEPGQAT